MSPDPRDVLNLLAGADPLRSSEDPAHPADHAAVEASLARVRDDMAAAAPPRRRRRTPRVVGASAAIVIGATGGAVADHFVDAHTGHQATEAEAKSGGPGEVLRMWGDNFGKITDQATADIPFPDESSRRAVLHDVYFTGPHEDVEITTGTLRGVVADGAVCAWVNVWAGAVQDGDETARRHAEEVLDSASRWPAVTALDPRQSMTGRVGDQGPEIPTRFGYLTPIQAAANRNDLTAMSTAVESGQRCGPTQVPNLDLSPALPSGPAAPQGDRS